MALYHIENILKCVFMFSHLFFSKYANTLAFIICLLAIFRQTKRPQYNRNYAQKLLFNEFTHNIFYILVVGLFESIRTILFYIPLIIHFWLGLCEYINIQKLRFPDYIHNSVTKTRENKNFLMLLKAFIEILLFLVNFFSFFVWFSFFQQYLFCLIFYYNFLRVKYLININTCKAFQEMDQYFGARFDNVGGNMIGRILLKYIRKFCQWSIDFDKKKGDGGDDKT